MPSTSPEREALLAGWLQGLVRILRAGGGPTWALLRRACAGRSAVIELDGVRLRLGAGGEPLRLEVQPAEDGDAASFASDAATLRALIGGRLLLDEAVTGGRISVRAPIDDLLRVHALVMAILADGALSAELRALWDEFDRTWPRSERPPPCLPLERQRPVHGRWARAVPADVLANGCRRAQRGSG